MSNKLNQMKQARPKKKNNQLTKWLFQKMKKEKD